MQNLFLISISSNLKQNPFLLIKCLILTLYYIPTTSNGLKSAVYSVISILYILILNFYKTKPKTPTMVEESKSHKRHKPEDLLSRFRSKEDLYRYLTQQGKCMHVA